LHLEESVQRTIQICFGIFLLTTGCTQGGSPTVRSSRSIASSTEPTARSSDHTTVHRPIPFQDQVTFAHMVTPFFGIVDVRSCQGAPGYRCRPERILATRDGGKSWSDITPARWHRQDAGVDAQFLTSSGGWLVHG